MIRIAVTVAAAVLFPTVATAAAKAQIDHLILGVSDLDQGVAAFEEMTGVRPAYGGKHPTGTHNALVALGEGLYLEIIAIQPGATPPAYFASLQNLRTLTPIGWAVSAPGVAEIRSQLDATRIPLTEPLYGSRSTPAGTTLSWHTFGLEDELEEAPFFIVWSPDTPHPSTTSPTGCRLVQWRIAGPNHEILERLSTALGLAVQTAAAPKPSFRLSLTCPKGPVEFASVPPHDQ